VLAEHGVELEGAPAAARRREGLAAYLELHIEQGPVLEREGVSVAAVSGTAGVERLRLSFDGQASHAGTTPMDMRRDAGLAAAVTALAVEGAADRHGGVGTAGSLELQPGIVTAVPGRAELSVDLRHSDADRLATMLDEVREAANGAASAHRCGVEESTIWRIRPIAFDDGLVRAAREEADGGRVIASGALHDAASLAPHVPTVMLFAPSTGGVSHAKEEDTPEPDLERAIAAFGRLAGRVLDGDLLG
jgi:hydantoinase/carbamoylase family amidase